MKRFWSAALAAGLLAAGSIPFAQAATKVPAKVQIEDPLNDANALNDQDVTGAPISGEGDHAAQADAGSVSDFLKVWFSNTKKTISVHILTERPPPATSTVYYRIAANPGEGEVGANTARGCLHWRMIFAGQQAVPVGGSVDTSTYRSSDPTKPASVAEFEDECNVAGVKRGEGIKVTVEQNEDDLTGITTMTVPRSFSPLFAKKGKIMQPYAISRVAVGQNGTEIPTQGQDFVALVTIDNTKRGADYAIKDKKRRRR